MRVKSGSVFEPPTSISSLDNIAMMGDAIEHGCGRFRVASGIAVGEDGSLFVAYFYNNRIQHFDHAGNFLAAWGDKGSSIEAFNGPTGVAVRGNTLYIADWGNHRIQKISLQR